MHIWTYMLARLTVSLRDLATWTHDLPTWSETRFALVHLGGGLCCDSRLCVHTSVLDQGDPMDRPGPAGPGPGLGFWPGPMTLGRSLTFDMPTLLGVIIVFSVTAVAVRRWATKVEVMEETEIIAIYTPIGVIFMRSTLHYTYICRPHKTHLCLFAFLFRRTPVRAHCHRIIF